VRRPCFYRMPEQPAGCALAPDLVLAQFLAERESEGHLAFWALIETL